MFFLNFKMSKHVCAEYNLYKLKITNYIFLFVMIYTLYLYVNTLTIVHLVFH